MAHTQQKKRQKLDVSASFGPGIFDQKSIDELREQVGAGRPYRWGHLTQLIDDELLRSVRKEVGREIHFTEKETDIYRVHQSGDLANLSGLDWEDLSRLPSVSRLREALYSKEFRDLISEVTQCGPLSGSKTDISINTYTKGCHLLTHDDVIGSRRVSFILYMPDPDRQWKPHYGGALRLFPALVPNVPQCDYSAKFVPQFNEMAFFKVQPGLSFHDVEEVRVDKHRLSIQGWYHIPQQGEEGYVEGEEATEAKSTLELLESKELQEYDFPKEARVHFTDDERGQVSSSKLNDDDLLKLAHFLREDLLKESEMERLQATFIDENLLQIDAFLNEEHSHLLKKLIRTSELDEKTPSRMAEVSHPWKMAVPPHKWRFMYIDGREEQEWTVEGVKQAQAPPHFASLRESDADETTKRLVTLAEFFQSPAFRKWIGRITDLTPTSDQVLVRRFRPGHDFTLATSIDTDALLEATLCLTPSNNWDECGGYELCMANEDSGDPAVYAAAGGDDSVLVNTQPGWNKLTLVARDQSVLKFVKYVGFNAPGSRWDVTMAWDVADEGGE